MRRVAVPSTVSALDSIGGTSPVKINTASKTANILMLFLAQKDALIEFNSYYQTISLLIIEFLLYHLIQKGILF